MDKADISSRIKEIIANKVGVPEGDVSEKSRFIDDLGADSLDLVELMMAVEDEFETVITDDEAESIKTVGQAIDLIFTKAR
ncbi:acyl carrier protein [Pseudomonas graminis]|uniref:Acyl carrier protein n=1 Tax=Pseudomonas graminis TaxID=158627 RepID=A0A6M8MTT9_9PSED|nr:acyl carrier protein [Pseudomonas graminis]QKF53323.1 Acyl carrier protein [Pseudomonas graminis]